MKRVRVIHHVYSQYRRDPNFEHLRYMSRFVPGIGPVQPTIVLIGESPSENDNKEILPFTGYRGILLGQFLEPTQTERAELFITYLVKYRTPSSRPVTVDEVQCSKPYLRLELLAVKPTIIVTLGHIAAQSFLPKVDLQESHGQLLHTKTGQCVVPMYAIDDQRHWHTTSNDFVQLASYTKSI